jgi:hypothetical protein
VFQLQGESSPAKARRSRQDSVPCRFDYSPFLGTE